MSERTAHDGIQLLFPTVVFKKRLELANDVVERAVAGIHEFARGFDAASEGRITADKAKQTLHLEPAMAEIMEPVFSEISRFLHDDLHFSNAITKFYVGRCWPVIQMNEAEGSLHFHAGAVFSGVFFLRAPKGSGGLEFVRPSRTFADGLYKTAYTQYTEPSHAFEVQSQEVWLFNGELWHRALPNAPGVAEPRIAFAFDIYTTSDLVNKSGGMPHFEQLRPLAELGTAATAP